MIKLSIHGTNGGFRLIYGEQRLFSDPNADTTSWQAIGQTAYSLMFLNRSCVFSRYKIIRDVIGDKRQGSIAFSVVITNNLKALSGSDIKSLIDSMYDKSHEKFIDGNNLGNVRDDWSFINDIVADYEGKLIDKSNFEEIQSGTLEPAVIYYNNDMELQEYLDKPYQNEYSSFKQIFLINSALYGKDENPINSLRNSGVELKDIDLKNEPFYLNNYDRSKGIKITAYFNNRWNERSDKKDEQQIRAKWQVEINYLKEYYKPINATGSISNSTSDIYKYLERNGSNIKIKYDAFQPVPKIKTIVFNVVIEKDRDEEVTDAEIQIGDYQRWQKLSEYTLKAEELGKEYKIRSRRGENLLSDVVKITPIKYPEDFITLDLPLIEKRFVKIKATDQETGDAIWQFKVHITGKDFYKVTDQIEFVGDEIDKEWYIQIEKRGEYSDSENRKFCPAKDGKEINFKLKKEKKQSNESSNYGNSGHNSGNHKSEKQKSFAAKAKVFFSKPAVIAASIIIALLVGFGIWFLFYLLNNKQSKEVALNKWEINMYVEGDSLMLDKLNFYKENWGKQEQDFITKSSGGMFGGDEIVDSTKWKKDWKPVYEGIDRAIKKRELINDKNIAELLNQNQHYSDKQLSFKSSIKKIDSTNLTEVVNELGDVSALTLTQITDSINKILTLKDKKNQAQPLEPKKEETKQEEKKETPNKIEKPNQQSNPQEQKTTSNDIISEIIKYLKGNELDEAKLEGYKNTKDISQNLKNSIQLCLDFWALDGSGSGKKSKTYWDFRNRVYNDHNFDNSKLKAFVDKMCHENNPSYSKMDKKKGLKL